jgi:hypothetical protein
MDAQTILSTARSGSVPSDWNVWPLRVDVVRRGLLGWVGAGLVGLVLFAGAAKATIPSNFEQGGFAIVVTLLLLGMLAVVGFGGFGVVIYDLWRLAHADEYLLVITPDDFVRATPGHIVHVPIENISFITLRGVRPPRFSGPSDAPSGAAGQRLPSSIRISPLAPVRQPRSSPSLAFVDTRDDAEVVVATDDSFESMYVLEQVLSDRVAAKERRRLA